MMLGGIGIFFRPDRGSDLESAIWQLVVLLGRVRPELGKRSIEKKRFLLAIAQMMGGGSLPMPEFFGPLFKSAFLVNKKSLFLQKCQCIEL